MYSYRGHLLSKRDLATLNRAFIIPHPPTPLGKCSRNRSSIERSGSLRRSLETMPIDRLTSPWESKRLERAGGTNMHNHTNCVQKKRNILNIAKSYVFRQEPWDGLKSTLAWASRDHYLPGIGLPGPGRRAIPAGSSVYAGLPKGGFQCFCWAELKAMARARMGYRCHGWRHLGRSTKRWRSAGIGTCRRTPLGGTRGSSALHAPDGRPEGSDGRHIDRKKKNVYLL